MIDFTGYGLIHRFSEDIDIHIRTNFGLTIEGKEDKPQVRAARKKFYDVLANSLSINGITEVKRDYDFDDTEKYRSGGIRLYYQSQTTTLEGLKDGILLEAGFDTITPNKPINISSWVWEHLVSINASSSFIDNTAIEVQCYHPGYTLVEKLQTIVRKYRNKDNPGSSDEKNFIRQYYDVYCLLGNSEIQEFIDSHEYLAHKAARIKDADNLIPLNEHPSLLLNDLKLRESFINRYLSTSKLYYNGQPDFEDILARIAVHVNRF